MSATRESLEWQVSALCAQTDPEVFFPPKGCSTKDAKQVCMACNVRATCLSYALTEDLREGIWGGLSAQERRVIRIAANKQQSTVTAEEVAA